MKTTKIEIRMTENFKNDVIKAASEKEMSVSEYIRYLMRKEIEKPSN